MKGFQTRFFLDHFSLSCLSQNILNTYSILRVEIMYEKLIYCVLNLSLIDFNKRVWRNHHYIFFNLKKTNFIYLKICRVWGTLLWQRIGNGLAQNNHVCFIGVIASRVHGGCRIEAAHRKHRRWWRHTVKITEKRKENLNKYIICKIHNKIIL